MRILFVAMAHSLHTARWISQLDGQGWDLHLFPVEDARLHPDLRNLVVHDARHGRPPGLNGTVQVVDDFWPFLRNGWPFPRGAYLARRLTKRRFKLWDDRAWGLAHTIRRLKPDIVHSMEMIKAGHLVLQAKSHLTSKFPPWIATNWGNELYFYGRLPEYADKVKAVLSDCDYFTCDCQRDVVLARAFGFEKEVLDVLPVPGGYDLQRIIPFRQAGPTSSRRYIALKGYQDSRGRALVALRAIELCADVLQDYHVAVYMASPDIQIAATLLSQSTGILIEIIPELPHEEILRLHGQARISIGVSTSDGLANAVLDAMLMGSFPIQSNTSCADEWLIDGETALFVHPDDPQSVAAAIRRAVTDDALVDHASQINARLATERFSRAAIQPRAIAMYEKVAQARLSNDRRTSGTVMGLPPKS